MSGLWHLEGENATVVQDGAVVADLTVTNGTVTLADSVNASVIHVGADPVTATLQTMRLEAGADNGVAQGRRGRTNKIVMRVLDTAEGLEYGSDFTTMDTWDTRAPSDPMDAPVPLYTGDSPAFTMPSGWEREKRVALRHAVGTPCTIVAIFPQVHTEV